MHLQAAEYENEQKKDLGEFFSLIGEEVTSKKLKELLREVMKRR